MTTTYTHFGDLAKEARPPDKGILSRTLYNDDRLKAVAMCEQCGQSFAARTSISTVTRSLTRPAASRGVSGMAAPSTHCLGRRTVSRSDASSIPLTECGSPVGRQSSFPASRWCALPKAV
jgi:hypothetical protein